MHTLNPISTRKAGHGDLTVPRVCGPTQDAVWGPLLSTPLHSVTFLFSLFSSEALCFLLSLWHLLLLV